MWFIYTCSYDHYDMWKRYKKPTNWLRGYSAGFAGHALPLTACDEFRQGHKLGIGDRQRESNPPYIKGGLGSGYGLTADERVAEEGL